MLLFFIQYCVIQFFVVPSIFLAALLGHRSFLFFLLCLSGIFDSLRDFADTGTERALTMFPPSLSLSLLRIYNLEQQQQQQKQLACEIFEIGSLRDNFSSPILLLSSSSFLVPFPELSFLRLSLSLSLSRVASPIKTPRALSALLNRYPPLIYSEMKKKKWTLFVGFLL